MTDKELRVSEAQIAAHWQEENKFPPAPGFIAQANMTDIEQSIGKIARPKNAWIVPDMPKTRSGKIMRRVLTAISNGRDVGDVTTLANPDVV